MNLLHWSPSVDLLAVALDYSVYIWVPSTGKITCLCDTDEVSNYISSVRWIEQGAQLAIGSASGHVQVFINVEIVKNQINIGNMISLFV